MFALILCLIKCRPSPQLLLPTWLPHERVVVLCLNNLDHHLLVDPHHVLAHPFLKTLHAKELQLLVADTLWKACQSIQSDFNRLCIRSAKGDSPSSLRTASSASRVSSNSMKAAQQASLSATTTTREVIQLTIFDTGLTKSRRLHNTERYVSMQCVTTMCVLVDCCKKQYLACHPNTPQSAKLCKLQHTSR